MRKLLRKLTFLTLFYKKVCTFYAFCDKIIKSNYLMKRIYMTKNEKTTESATTKKTSGNKVERSKSIIIGIGTLLLVLSCSYAIIVIYQGLDGWAPKILILPMAFFVVGKLVQVFTSAYSTNK